MPQRCNAEASERGANLVAKTDIDSTKRARATTIHRARGTATGGFTMTPRWLLCRTEVSGNAKLLYGLIASHVDGKGLAPGCTKLAIAKVRMKTLARELLGSDSDADYKTIQRLVKELKEHGLIFAHLHREKSAASDYSLLEHGWMEPQDKPVPRLGSEMGGPQDKPVPSLGTNLSLASGQNCPDPQDKFVLGDKISSQDLFQDRAAEIASARAHEHAQAPARAGSSSSGKNGSSRAPLAIVPPDEAAIVRAAEQKKAVAKHDAKKAAEQKKEDADAAIKSMLTRPPEEQQRQLWSIRSRFLSNGDAERGGMSEEELAERIKYWKGLREIALEGLRDLRDAGDATPWKIDQYKVGRYLEQREIDAVLKEPRRPRPVVPSSAAAPYRPFRADVAEEGEGEDLNEREASNDC